MIVRLVSSLCSKDHLKGNNMKHYSLFSYKRRGGGWLYDEVSQARVNI